MSEELPIVYLARHGETARSLTGQHTGLTDLPLAEPDERNARQLGERLHGLTFPKVYTSPLQRAARTCELAGFGAVAEVDPDLAGWDYGQYEGQDVRERHLRQLFADDPGRGERLTAEAVGLYLDYSKNRITNDTLRLLLQLAEECGLRARIDAMFRGDKINITEDRAVLHVALRAPHGTSIVVDGRERGAPGARRARQDGGLLSAGTQWCLAGSYRQAHPQRHQHRHRRFGPRPSDGL